MEINFIKMQGLGNDFVVVDARGGFFSLAAEEIRHICDRRRGVGADTLVMMLSSSAADICMKIYNADGSEAEACGNATRCVAGVLMAETGGKEVKIETRAGLLTAVAGDNELICIDMGRAYLNWQEIPLSTEIETENVDLEVGGLSPACVVSMGNPHAVFFVDDVAGVSVETLGPQIERHPLFPARTNVEFVSILGSSHVRMRVWERGVGITPACGTGACAAAVAAIRRGLVPQEKEVRVSLDGGDLHIFWRQEDGHVLMTGPWAEVFRGTFAL